MRIISGELGGRKINPPNNMPFTRPTTDMAKEGLFNVIENNMDLSVVRSLDLFGGTGSISYELFSRGVKDLTIIEKDPEMYNFIKKTAEQMAVTGMKLIRSDVFKFMLECNEQFNFVFAGPPYALGNIEDIPKIIFQKGLLANEGWFILEHTPRNDFKDHPYFRTERKYGTTIFSIFINRPIETKA
ncbi:MAG: RsmD family RNA methyltransferase [bacterium]|jgi:16S rRNA (guanine966-N2)-methyltransferase|nr:RsmD family RNA methyltransferase [Chitinophagaceae bacterium]